MNSFKRIDNELPLNIVWMLNSISEYKGKQELYIRQSPQMLKALVEMALIESAESSNRIEGVTVDKERLKPLIVGNSRPRDRSEEEVAEYKKALDLIHKKYEDLEITPKLFQELHRISHAGADDAGSWKKKNNDIIRRNPDGSVEVIFRPVSADLVPKSAEQLCLVYKHSIEQLKYPPLYAIACLVFDFLCIHPFRDANGRVSRLLTLLVLYQHGYNVGRYISIERIIEQSKEIYYETLQKSSQRWHDGKHDIFPWLGYFLGTIISAYREFERRAGDFKSLRGAKTEIIIQAIKNQLGEFSVSDIERVCQGISRDMVRVVFRQMQKDKKIKCLGMGQTAKWKQIG